MNYKDIYMLIKTKQKIHEIKLTYLKGKIKYRTKSIKFEQLEKCNFILMSVKLITYFTNIRSITIYVINSHTYM